MLAHRWAWTLEHGDIPPGMLVCHRCDNRRCVNPGHLFLGTHSDNTIDAVKKGRWPLGEQRKNVKLTPERVKEIKRLRTEGFTHRKLAKMFGVAKSTIGAIYEGRSWRWLS